MKRQFLTLMMALIATTAFGQVKDWAQTNRYENDNASIKASGVKPKVVFIGDSITDFWYKTDKDFFTENGFVGRGISGQTTCETLVRMRQDVIDLHPKTVVILIGVNDIAQNNGPVTKQTSLNNIISMCELAKANKIKPILCSLLPASHFRWRPNLTPAQDVKDFNVMLQEYAKKAHITYVDYYPALTDEQGGVAAQYSKDTVHPTLEGYKIMEEIILKYLK